MDVHIQVGLRDEFIRVNMDGWNKILNLWVLAHEDIVLRIVGESYEKNIVLRGQEGGILDLRTYDPNKNLPRAVVVSAEELRATMLAQQNLG